MARPPFFKRPPTRRPTPRPRSRFILMSVDESPEQTRAILEAQRQSHTLEGWRQRQAREAILRRHHAFQRLLKPVVVVNPFEPLLSYPDEQLLVRRDHPKYLHLILAVTFLHQLQRPVKHDADLGDYIETTLDDIAIANDLAHQLFGHSLDDLSRPEPRTAGSHRRLRAKKGREWSTDKVSLQPPRIARGVQVGRHAVAHHLEELVEMEYLRAAVRTLLADLSISPVYDGQADECGPLSGRAEIRRAVAPGSQACSVVPAAAPRGNIDQPRRPKEEPRTHLVRFKARGSKRSKAR